MATLRLSLPAELLRPIVDSGVLDQADLCILAQATRLLRDEGQRILFRDPGLIKLHLSDEHIGRSRAFFDAILSSPHRLALMVHTYQQSTDWGNGTDTGQDVTRSELLMKMTEALTLMANLKVFHSYGPGARTDTPGSMIQTLCQCRFKLEEFAWNHQGDELRLLEEFLLLQDNIRFLQLDSGFDIRGAADSNNTDAQRLLLAGKNACPKLETLIGPMSSSRVFLPGKHSVRFLVWSWAFHITEALNDIDLHAAHVCDSLKSLLYLEYESSGATGFEFATIAPYLSSLVVLTISNKCIKDVSELSCGIRTLRAIHFFNEGFWNISTPEDADRDGTFISSIFTLFEKLKFVDVDRQLDPSPCDGELVTCVLTSKQFIVAPETKEVTATQVNRSGENWWRDRSCLVAELSAET